MSDDIPRRNRLDKMTPAELAPCDPPPWAPAGEGEVRVGDRFRATGKHYRRNESANVCMVKRACDHGPACWELDFGDGLFAHDSTESLMNRRGREMYERLPRSAPAKGDVVEVAKVAKVEPARCVDCDTTGPTFMAWVVEAAPIGNVRRHLRLCYVCRYNREMLLIPETCPAPESPRPVTFAPGCSAESPVGPMAMGVVGGWNRRAPR